MERNILVIINPIAGTRSKRNVATLVRDALGEVSIVYTERAGHGHELALAAAGHYDIVVAVGGDGTVNEVASGLMGSTTALGIVPCGSGNGLARDLGLPMRLRRALHVINDGTIDNFDCGEVNGKPFFCTCGVGFDAQVSHAFAKAGTRGFITYIRTTIQEYFSFRPANYRLTIDGETIDEQAFVIAVCNAAQYGNNAFIAPHASMQDGMLDVTVLHRFSLMSAPLVSARLFMRQLDKDKHYSVYRGRHIVIERDDSGPMHLDGEAMVMPARLDIVCHPALLRIVTPKVNNSSV